MSWIGDKEQSLVSNDKNKVEEEEEEEEKMENNIGVTTHVHIKAAHTGGSLDKEVVLRRIRQRKRAHKVQAAFQSLVTSPFSANATATATASSNSNTHKRWIDDAFAAL